jgi:hypothetical protein
LECDTIRMSRRMVLEACGGEIHWALPAVVRIPSPSLALLPISFPARLTICIQEARLWPVPARRATSCPPSIPVVATTGVQRNRIAPDCFRPNNLTPRTAVRRLSKNAPLANAPRPAPGEPAARRTFWGSRTGSAAPVSRKGRKVERCPAAGAAERFLWAPISSRRGREGKWNGVRKPLVASGQRNWRREHQFVVSAKNAPMAHSPKPAPSKPSARRSSQGLRAGGTRRRRCRGGEGKRSGERPRARRRGFQATTEIVECLALELVRRTS